jgi:hypothetical protein
MKACLPFLLFSMGDTPGIEFILRCKQIQETKKKEQENGISGD